uniref:Uncharacterized protein n=1 Tax=Anguilla anguilla TaxID=7936 RepID=A0A0E9UEQ9_ANGAN
MLGISHHIVYKRITFLCRQRDWIVYIYYTYERAADVLHVSEEGIHRKDSACTC